MLSKSSKWELGFVRYITKFTISRYVISRFECIFIFLQSTVLKKRPGFENICHVTGFVTKDLDTLEERRLVIVRNNQQDDLHLESRPLFRGGKVIPK